MKTTNDSSDIQNFYQNSTIFLTGPTGFLGKLILEKLLRTTEFKHIYLLIREKNNETIQEKFEKIFQNKIFDTIKRTNVNFLSKITPILGDCSLKNFGLDQNVWKKLTKEIDCIFHFATSKLDDTLSNSIKINIGATKQILEFAKETKQLKALVYISPVNAHTEKKGAIGEQYSECFITGENLLKSVENPTENLLQTLLPKIQKIYPNSYYFTKAASVDFLREQGKGLPIAIVRPSFVISAAEDPITGYVENSFGPTQLLLNQCLGIIKIFVGNDKFACDLIPADFVINAVLASAWDVSNAHTTRTKTEITIPGEVKIYNCVSSPENSLTWGELQEKFLDSYKGHPSKSAIWYPFGFSTTCIYNYYLLAFFLHILPAWMGGKIGNVFGKKCGAIKAYEKIGTYLMNLKYFTMNEYYFTNKNCKDLFKKLSFKDKKLYNFDMSSLNWENFFQFYTKGCRVYICNEPMETVTEAKEHFEKLKKIHYFSITILAIFSYFTIRFFIKLLLGVKGLNLW